MEFLIKSSYISACDGHLFFFFVKSTHFRCHKALHLTSSRTSHFSVQKCTCLITLKASIDTITMLTSRSDSSSVYCSDSTTGQTMYGVLAEWLQSGVVALFIRQPVRRRPEHWRSDSSQVLLLFNTLSTVWPFMEPAKRTEQLPKLLVKMVMMTTESLNVLKHMHLIFLHTEVTCVKTFQMQSCVTAKMSRFLHII